MTYPEEQSTNIAQGGFTRMGHVIAMVLIGAFMISCEAFGPGNPKIADGEVVNRVNQTKRVVNSLVASEHSDPISFLQSPEYVSVNPGRMDLFRKYVGLSHYFIEYLKDYNSALIYADSTLQLFEESSHAPELEAYHLFAILQKGDVLRKQYMYGTAIQYYLQGWRLADSEQTPCLAKEILGRMGTMSYEEGNYAGSIDFYTQAWQTASDCLDLSDFNRLRRDYQHFHNLASNYEELSMPDSALYYYELSLHVFEKDSADFVSNPDQQRFVEIAKGVAQGNKGVIFRELDRGEEAEALWKESIRINVRPGFANEHAELMRLRLAEHYIDEGRMEEAEKELAIARNWLNKFRSDTGERRWRKAQWKWLDKMGETERAYVVYQHYMELEKTITDQKLEAGAIDLAAQIRLSDQQHEITRLQIDREIKNLYLILAVIISLMTIAILILIWQNWQRSKNDLMRITRLHETVSEQNHQLEQKNKTIAKVMSTVAHDLRSPVYGINELSLLLTDHDNLTDQQKKWIRLIKNANLLSMKLIKKILNFKFNQPKEDRIRIQPVALKVFIQQCIELSAIKAREKNQTIQLEMSEAAECKKVYLDRNEMARVINNLLGNAIKFSSEGATIFVKLECPEEADTIWISVKDEGIGIPEHLKDFIFDMFTEARRPGTRNEESIGLGLSISKQIVEAHGGQIWFESKEGVGTTFTVEIPVEQKKPENVEL